MEIILLAALSADGFIARHQTENSTKWTSKEDAQWFSRKTKEIGICIMGRTTYDTIGRALPDRVILVLSKSGQPIADAPQLVPTPEGTVFVTNSSPEDVVEALAQRGVAKIAICGGSTIYHQFLALELVHHIFLTIEPQLFGQGISLAHQPLQTKLELLQIHPLSEQTIVLEYLVARPEQS